VYAVPHTISAGCRRDARTALLGMLVMAVDVLDATNTGMLETGALEFSGAG